MIKYILYIVTFLFSTCCLSQVNANYNNNRVEISWTQPDISSIKYYVIEKSKNGKYFKPLLVISSNTKLSSSFLEIDISPYKKQTYYRIRYVNKNGNYYYSEKVVARNYYSKKLPTELIGFNKLNVLVVLKNNSGVESYAKLNIKEFDGKLMAETFNMKIASGNYIITGTDEDLLLGQKISIINPEQNNIKYLSDTLNTKLR